MKFKFLIIFISFAFTWIYSQQLSETEILTKIDKLPGEWHSEKNTSITVEHWEKISEKTYEGYGKFINKTDRTEVMTESLRLVEMSGEIFYLAKVSHNKFPVPFKLIESNDTTLIFENSEHDFPKRIEYSFTGNDKMNVTVGSGEKAFTIEFDRVKN